MYTCVMKYLAVLALLYSCVPEGFKSTCTENIGALDGSGSSIIWKRGWDEESCIFRLFPEKPVESLVFSVETSGVLLLEHLTEASEMNGLNFSEFWLLRIDGESDEAIDNTDIDFIMFSISGRQYYFEDIETGTYVIEAVSVFGNREEFKASVKFRSHRRRLAEIDDIVERFESEGGQDTGHSP